MGEAKALFMKSLSKGHVSLAEQLFPHLSFSDKERMEIFKRSLYLKSSLYETIINQMATEQLSEALFRAILDGKEEAVRLLLRRGADPKQHNRYGEGTLHLAIKARGTSLNMIAGLIQYGADIQMINRHNLTPILKAASFGLLEVVEYLDRKHIENRNKSLLNEEVLSRAAGSNHKEIVKYCIKRGIKVNQKAYFMSILFNQDEMVKFLLNQDHHSTFTALSSQNPLAIAACKGRTELLQLLIQQKLPLNSKERVAICSAALMAAIEADNGHLIHLLLKAGADINYVDEEESVLDVAITAGKKEIAAILKKLGAKRHINSPTQKVVHLMT
jgi:ankyrin repeat protein